MVNLVFVRSLMKIKLCYENYKIGELSFDGEEYMYKSLPDKDEFLKQYGFIKFDLAEVKKNHYQEMPYFFAEFVERLIHNVGMSTKLNINLNEDSYFDILYRYAKLPQVKNTFYFIAD